MAPAARGHHLGLGGPFLLSAIGDARSTSQNTLSAHESTLSISKDPLSASKGHLRPSESPFKPTEGTSGRQRVLSDCQVAISDRGQRALLGQQRTSEAIRGPLWTSDSPVKLSEDPLRPTEGSLRLSEGPAMMLSRRPRDLRPTEGPLMPTKGLFRPTKGPFRLCVCFENYPYTSTYPYSTTLVERRLGRFGPTKVRLPYDVQ